MNTIKAKKWALHVAMCSFALGFILRFIFMNGYDPRPDEIESFRDGIWELFLCGLATSAIVTLSYSFVCRLLKKK